MKTLLVKMNNILIGRLSKHRTGQLAFAYDSSWLNSPYARPISLSLPLLETEFSGDIVYSFFDNLLPDNPRIRAKIQAHFQAKTDQPFDLLSFIGKDCIGAIQLVNESQIEMGANKLQFMPLDENQIADLLRGLQLHPLGMQSAFEDFRISLAGVQEKTALLYWNDQWCLPERSTPSTHIFKLPISNISAQHLDLSDSCENEWLCGKIASAFGLPTASSEILYFKDIKCLAVKRFDRKLSSNGENILRLPQEDMCQALGISANLKYESDGGPGISSIMKLLLGSASAIEDRDTFFKSQILFYLLAAIDGHAKNFSIKLLAEGGYHLAPLYDIISAHPLIASKALDRQKVKLSMALIGKNKHYNWSKIEQRHFLSTAKKTQYSVEKASALLNTMLSSVDSVIAKVSKQLPDDFPKKISDSIFSGMLKAKNKLQRSS